MLGLSLSLVLEARLWAIRSRPLAGGKFVLRVGVIRPLFDFIFRCQHRKTTFPRKQTIEFGGSESKTYVVCLDCGKQFVYDWENMRLGKAVHTSSSSQGFTR